MARADCSSYMAITVTPATTTVTATSTLTNTDTAIATVTFESTTYQEPPVVTVKRRSHNHAIRDGIEVRQATVSPTAIPTYASACSGAVRYSSACSCIGVTQYTVIAAAATTTITVPGTVTTTTTTSTSTTTTSTRTWEPQCSPGTISSGPVNLVTNAGYAYYAGAIDGPNGPPAQFGPILSVEDCCSACYYYGNCFAFLYDGDNNSCGLWSSDFSCSDDTGTVVIQDQTNGYVGNGPCAGEIFFE